jgi:ribosome biogenesis GTPase A
MLTFFLQAKFENFIKKNSRENISFEENPSNSIFSQKNFEKENLKTYVSKIMVIGEKSTGKKTLINMLFRRNQQLRDENTSAFTKGLR